MSDRDQLRNALRHVLALAPTDGHGKRFIEIEHGSSPYNRMPVAFPEAFDVAARLLDEDDEIEAQDKSGSMRY